MIKSLFTPSVTLADVLVAFCLSYLGGWWMLLAAPWILFSPKLNTK
jgi:hypothetical protein